MDNENGTTAIVENKVNEAKTVEEVITKPTDTIDSVSIEASESDKVVKSCSAEIVESSVNLDETKNINSSEMVNKTTTTVTVNVTQTKVTIDDANTKKDSTAAAVADEVVSTVANISGAAIDAVQKIEQSTKPSTKIEIPNTSVTDNDIEMPEVNDDIEMKDISSTDEPPQTTKTNTNDVVPKKIEADSANDINEAEQKIDDVEKNISNLFNGDDNVVSTNSQSFDEASKEKLQTGSTSNDALKNGPDNSCKESPSDDVIKDNNDLVSILAGNDNKADDKGISSSQNDIDSAPDSNNTQKSRSITNDKNVVESKSAENKLLKNISTASSSTPSVATVYNSTPIQKQFEISSENVSTISESAIDTEHILGDESTRQEIISSHSSSLIEKSSNQSSTAVTGNESEQTSSSDNVTRFANAVRTLNGTSDETDTSMGKPEPVSSVSTKSNTNVTAPSKAITSSVSTTFENHVYEVNFCYDNKELVYFSVERLDTNKSQSISDNSSSIGSVNSVQETFALPARSVAVTSTNSTLSSSSSSELGTTTVANNTEKTKHELKGTIAMCDFIIAHFTKLSAELKGADEQNATKSNETTPVSTGGRRRGTNATPTTPSIQASGSKRKRGAVQSSPIDLDTVDDQPKSAKKAKKTVEPSTPTTSNYPEKAVLARWVDKKFYAGRVIDQKPNNKFVVLFEDGAKKVLPEEHIVFGDQNILPLLNESVHALVKEDTYEPGLVQTVETKDDGIYYTVLCESTTVKVTASDIYLEDDQAKVILSKHASNNPEPGFSGGINTRKDRRQKRNTIGGAV